MDKQPRRHFADHEKVAILKRHLIDKVPVSDLCDELDLYPNQFYDWLKKFFENGHLAFANGRAGRKPKTVETAQQARIQQLEAKLHKKNEVMAELMEALTEEKKRHGEL
jgi:transposase